MEEDPRKSYNNSKILEEDIIDCQEYFLLKDNIINKIIIGEIKNEIFIKCRNYFISFNLIELLMLIKIKFNSLNKAYFFIINLFEYNKVTISKIIENEEIQLIMKINNDKNIELSLKYDNKFNNNNYNPIFKEINKLKNEINKLKKYYEISNLKNIVLSSSNIVNDSYAGGDLDNSFTVFKAINNILYLIYANKNKSIICYDINELKKIKELKTNHNEYITNFRHYLDELNKRDLIMSISMIENSINIWNLNNWECIQNITNINSVGYLCSSCFLFDNKGIHIITSNMNNDGNSEYIKVFNLKGQKIKEISDSNDKTYFIDVFYENKSCKNYIITGNHSYVKSYDFTNNNLYRIYNDNSKGSRISVIVKNYENFIKLIESSHYGSVRIWDFHSASLLNKIKIIDTPLYGMCLWKDNYLFVGCSDKTIKLIDLKNILIIKNLTSHDNRVITIKKIIHPKYKECFLSQNYLTSEIKLWVNKNNYI